MALLADYPRPAHVEWPCLKPFAELDEMERSADGYVRGVTSGLKRAEELLSRWEDERDKRLGFREKLFHRRKWRKAGYRTLPLLRVLRPSCEGLFSTYLRGVGNMRPGKYENDRWFDGDEILYCALGKQRQVLDSAILTPLSQLRDLKENEISTELVSNMVAAVHDIHRATNDALADFYRRVRPLWEPRKQSSLPAPFCPVALAVQLGQPVPESQKDCTSTIYGLKYWICQVCSGATKALYQDAAPDPLKAAFVAHLQAKCPSEKVKHACPDCYEVFDTVSDFDSHLFDQKWENWWCGDPPPLELMVNELEEYKATE